ncbi:MAG: putative membrane protein [Marivirga sp.]|jgi:uncharacterized membrane protein
MISKIIALKLMIGLLSIVILFHLCVLLEIISYKIVWAGRLNSKEEMYVFEALSILINIFLIIVLYIKFQNIKNKEANRVINVIIWVFVFLFALNTFGNIFAESLIEQIIGTLITFISAALCWIIVKKNNKRNVDIM